MPGLLADANIEGQCLVLLNILQSEFWRDVWQELRVTVCHFADLKLSKHVSDLKLWRACQDHDLVLLTGNRNLEGEDSLEAVIRRFNTPTSLPVFTLADPVLVLRDKRYAHLVAERLLERLIEIEIYRGAGRIYLP